ncbi:MAG: TetR/AcrR family transcriptional regulator [Pseudomonadota bacterium]
MARKQGSHSEITGPKVKQAALRLFASSGFAAVSMRQIAAEVGVQAGALYSYTPDKQSLLFDLMKGHMDALLNAWAEIEKIGNPEHDLKAFVTFHMHFHFDRPDEVFVAYMELRNLSPENFVAIERLRKAYEGHLVEILHAGQNAGMFGIEDMAVTTRALIAMLTGVTTWYRDDGQLSRDQVVGIYWQLVARSVGMKGQNA